MISEEQYARGADLLERMVGADRVAAARAAFVDASPEFERYVVGFLAGEIWSRPGLDLKTRSLVTIAALAALGRPRALRFNIEMAIHNGATRQELVETMIQMAGYAGFPACWEGLAVVREVFDQLPDGHESHNRT